jgi:hypothetical protein
MGYYFFCGTKIARWVQVLGAIIKIVDKFYSLIFQSDKRRFLAMWIFIFVASQMNELL